MKRTDMKQTVKEFIWSRIRELKTFTMKDLITNAPSIYKLEKNKVRHHLKGWESAGYLSRESETVVRGRRPAYIYTLIKDTGVHPPALYSDGRSMKTHLPREQMWRTMRMIGTFNYRQLAKTASTDEILISESCAKTFVEALARSGYLKMIKDGCKATGIAMYQFKPTMWTGSKPPFVQTPLMVYDQNTHQIVYPKPEDIKGDY